MTTVLLLLVVASANDGISCGAACVAAYVRCATGTDCDVKRLQALLPVRPAGNSAKEVVSAAGEFGVHLTMMRLSPKDGFVPKAGIGYFNRQGNGHFAFLHRVDSDGNFVQLLDAPRFPEIVPFTELFGMRGFTGIVLAESHTFEVGKLLVVVGLGVVVALLLLGRRRGRQLGR